LLHLRWAVPAALALNLLLLAACGSSTPAPNPTPAISGLFPSEMTAGSQGFTLFISGSNFMSTSTAQWNGSSRPTTYNSASTQLLVTITAADVQNPGLAQVTVTNPPPGGGSSLALSFTINPAENGGPIITSISPSSAPLNSPAFTLQVTGTNFVPGSDYVTWNGGLRTTCAPPAVGTCSATQLFAAILATDLTQQMTASVAVHTTQLGVASPSVSFQVGSSTSSAAKFPQVVSANMSGGPADGASASPAMSADGRYVAFYSDAKNLVAGASGNIFVRDTCLGALACTPRTSAVDVAPDGSAPDAPGGSVDGVAISADGRYVGFASWATNLVSGAPGSQPRMLRAFVRDTCLGNDAPANCLQRTDVVSLNPKGEPIEGRAVALSADGRFVAFTSREDRLSSEEIVFVRDTCKGASADAACTPRTVLASMDGENKIVVGAGAPAISSDGRYVTFAGWPAGAPGANAKTVSQVFVRDTCLGVRSTQACAASTSRVSLSADGELGDADSRSPSISGDGRFVVFQSGASDLDGPPTGRQEIYVRDTCAGPTAPFNCVPATTRISTDAVLPAALVGSYSPAVSPSGRYMSYMVQTETDDPWADAQALGYVAVHDSCFGATAACSARVTQLIAFDKAASMVPLVGDIRMRVPLSSDGRFAAFFTNQVVPADGVSGLGDVLLTTTAFQTQRR
jgi:trimeric autotransporter adhesin